MGLDDHFFNDEQKQFFKEAYKIIYHWLPFDKKIKLALELASEGLTDTEKLNEREQFFHLLHFLEVNYVKIINWTEKTLDLLNIINQTQLERNKQRIEIAFDGENNLTDVYQNLKKSEVDRLFFSVLDQLEIKSEYEQYLLNLKGGT